MNGMMLHCGGEEITRESLGLIEIPEATATYRPVKHTDLVSLIEDRFTKEFPGVEHQWEFGVNKEGQQFFGLATLHLDDEEFGLSIACRNSYDKSLSVGFAAGAQVFVCDNLCLSGSSVTILRRHTQNVWEDIRGGIFQAVASSQVHFDDMRVAMGNLREIDVTTDRGYEHIGRALGHGILTPNQSSVAVKEWREPSHKEFLDRNAFSLYNAFTEAGKRGAPGRVLDRYSGFHDFFVPEGKEILSADYTVQTVDVLSPVGPLGQVAEA